MSSAVEERMGHVVRLRHDVDCDGWIHDGFVTGRERTENGAHPSKPVPTVRPCDVCEPGKHAVWRAGLTGAVRKADRDRARVIYRQAEDAAAAGVRVPEPGEAEAAQARLPYKEGGA